MRRSPLGKVGCHFSEKDNVNFMRTHGYHEQ